MEDRTAHQRERDLYWLFVCTTQRDSEHAACGDGCGADVVTAVKAWLRERDLFWTRVAVVETSCLGLCCETGAAVSVQPTNEWYTEVTPADVPALLDSVLSTEDTAGPSEDCSTPNVGPGEDA